MIPSVELPLEWAPIIVCSPAMCALLSDGSCSDDEEKDLISELKVLKHVGAHPNIVCLLGAAVNNGGFSVVVCVVEPDPVSNDFAAVVIPVSYLACVGGTANSA